MTAVGRAAAAVAAAEEAVAIRTALAEADPDIYLPKLANSWYALAQAGAHDIAVARSAAEHAVTLFRRLAKREAGRFDAQLRASSHLLSELTKR
jgi:hypothetical protein